MADLPVSVFRRVLAEGWGAACAAAGVAPAPPLVWENDPTTQPPGAGGDPFVFLAVIGGRGAPAALEASGPWRDEGRLAATICVPAGSGSDLAWTLVRVLSRLCRGPVPGTGLRFGSVDAGPGGEDDGAYWHLGVLISWSQDVPN